VFTKSKFAVIEKKKKKKKNSHYNTQAKKVRQLDEFCAFLSKSWLFSKNLFGNTHSIAYFECLFLQFFFIEINSKTEHAWKAFYETN